MSTPATDKSFLVIVSGPPCTGKSTVAERLARDLELPLLSKDRIKEPLFDALGWSDRAWSRKLGAAALDILFMLAETELTAHRSFLLEGNFRPSQANAEFRRLMDKYSFDAFRLNASPKLRCCCPASVNAPAYPAWPSWTRRLRRISRGG